jgi:AcrR family transcriptional regulator
MLKGFSKVRTEVRREQITRAALDTIAGHGVKGLTTSAIARKAGISGANLYRHFENKDEILNSVVARIGEDLLRNLESVQGTAPGKPLLELKKLFELHLRYLENNKGIPRLLFSEETHLDNPRVKGKFLDAINSYVTGIASLITDGQKDGTIDQSVDPQLSALTMVGMVQITVMKWSLNGFSFSLVDEGMKLWNNFERCIAAR